MMTEDATASPDGLLVLHAVRVAGVADDAAVAQRTGIDQHRVSDLLQDDEAVGWVTRVAFAGTSGWTLTERGRSEDARRLAEELDATGARDVVEDTARAFEPLNARLVRACTDWQLRPNGQDRLASNDHADPEWDARVLSELAALDRGLHDLIEGLAEPLPRFGCYHKRYAAALAQARAGQHEWVAGIDVASCHTVWMELHQDLLSTLGMRRNPEAG